MIMREEVPRIGEYTWWRSALSRAGRTLKAVDGHFQFPLEEKAEIFSLIILFMIVSVEEGSSPAWRVIAVGWIYLRQSDPSVWSGCHLPGFPYSVRY